MQAGDSIHRPQTLRSSISVTIAVIIVDLATKWLAAKLWSDQTTGLVTPSINNELALGTVSIDEISPVLVVVLCLFVAFAATYVIFLRKAWVSGAAFGLFAGGVLGNAIDRIVTGGVHDWLNLGVVIANVADFALLAGIVILVRAIWRVSDDW